MNPWEKECREFLKGCSHARQNAPEECPECLKVFCDHLRTLAAENPWEKACREFLKGCSCTGQGAPEECPECLKAFCDHLHTLAPQGDTITFPKATKSWGT